MIALLNILPAEIKERRHDRPHYPDPSLGAISSYLRGRGVECVVIDAKLERLGLAGTLQRLRVIRPLAIGFTAFTHEIEEVASSAAVLREEFPDTRFIIGGAHANALPGEVLSEFPVFDISVSGEGEEPMLDLVKSNFLGLEDIPSLAYRKEGQVVVNPRRSLMDISGVPLSDWRGFPKALYYPVFTSRGCRYKCIFCTRPFGQKVRYRDITAVLEEMRRVSASLQPRHIYIWDENFCSDKGRVLELLEKFRKERALKRIKWFCQANINDLDYALLEAMKRSGCIRIGIGIESGSNDMLERIGKQMTREKIIRAVGWIRKAGIPFEGYFIFGLPHEDRQSCKETTDLAVRLNPDFPVFGIAVPYPGTRLHEMAVNGEGGYRMPSRKWSDYGKTIGKAVELEGLPRRELERVQLHAYLSVLLKNFRVFSIIVFLFRFRIDIAAWLKNFFSRP